MYKVVAHDLKELSLNQHKTKLKYTCSNGHEDKWHRV